MGLRETAIQLLEKIPEYRLEEVISFLQDILADEEADDLFCEKLVEEYEMSPDKGILIASEDIDWDNLDKMFED